MIMPIYYNEKLFLQVLYKKSKHVLYGLEFFFSKKAPFLR